LPGWFDLKKPKTATVRQRHYFLDPRKFLYKTWDELMRLNVAKPTLVIEGPRSPRRSVFRAPTSREKQDAFQTTEAFGHLMMAMMADQCAGSTRQLVTDEVASYATLNRYLKLIGGAAAPADNRKDFDRLATLAVEALNLSRVNISALVELRSKEASKPSLRAMRHAYVEKLSSYIERLSSEARNKHDVKEIERQFKQDVTDDIQLLKEELKTEAKNVVMSKEFCTAVVAAAGTFLAPPNPLSPAGAMFSAAALGQTATKYRAARNKALSSHSMSWLYEVKSRRIRLF
jgi:hypothetical protein